MSEIMKVKLNNNVEMPKIGLGTWDLRGKTAEKAVKWAIEADYRLIDTAEMYGNEIRIGKAINSVDIPRDELFITTKVWENNHGYDKTLKAFEKSMNKLKVDYIDLYLIHWPRKLRHETWKALEELLEENKVRAIGVSNFTINHLKELIEQSSTVPSVNQVEFNPFLYQKQLLEFCKSRNIQLEAYSPLTRAHKLNNPKIDKISDKHNKSSAQILLRWGIQHGIVVIPKSGSKNHIQENINIFDFQLDDSDMEILDNMNENYRVVDDPCFSY
ncbi:MAG: aldo/keto reductase [Candidatus Lokiarchaeota archaeon]|nr:aldo/keto reductase [Candidatus Lokiarchaeota archaeon]MBD3340981.1 aldo/keto reductase [Candidatus Lokiarchaeota archaeon]